MVKRNLISVPHDVITRGNPEEPRAIRIEPERWIPMAEGSWRSAVFAQLAQEGGTLYKSGRLGSEPGRLSTWIQGTKMWDRWGESMKEFQRAAEWASKNIPSEDLQAGDRLTFQTKDGVRKELLFYG